MTSAATSARSASMHARTASALRRAHIGGIAPLLPATVFLAGFFLIPVGYGIYISLTGHHAKEGPYQQIATHPYYAHVLIDTLVLALVVTAICALLAYPCAYFLARHQGATADLIAVGVVTPLALSAVTQSFGWVVILGRRGPLYRMGAALGLKNPPELLYRWPGLAIALVQILLPYMVIAIASVLGNVPVEAEDAAKTLGAAPWRVLLRISIPLSLDGIATGAIIVFMLAAGGVVTPLLVGSGATETIPLLIYQQINNLGDYAFAAALGNVLLLAAVVLLFLQLRLLRTRRAR